MIPQKLQPFYQRGSFDVASIEKEPKILLKFFHYQQGKAKTPRARAAIQPLLNRLLDNILGLESKCRPDQQVRAICTQPDCIQSGLAMTFLRLINPASLADTQIQKLFRALSRAELLNNAGPYSVEQIPHFLQRASIAAKLKSETAIEVDELRKLIYPFVDRFPSVTSLEVSAKDGSVAVTSHDVLAIKDLLPNLTTLDVPAKLFPQDALHALLESSKIDCLILRDAESVEKLTFERLTRNVTIFCVGEIPPTPLQTVNFSKNATLIMVPATAPEDDVEARVFYELSNWSDRHLLTLMKYCPEVEELKITSGPGITDSGLDAFTQKFSNLSSLMLVDCPQVSDHALRKVATTCHNLHWIDFTGSAVLSDDTLIAFKKNAPNSIYFYLHSCTKLTNRSIEKLLRLPRLEVLEVTDCSGLRIDLLVRDMLLSRCEIASFRIGVAQFTNQQIECLRVWRPTIKIEIPEVDFI